jgi:hypothetical protein
MPEPEYLVLNPLAVDPSFVEEALRAVAARGYALEDAAQYGVSDYDRKYHLVCRRGPGRSHRVREVAGVAANQRVDDSNVRLEAALNAASADGYRLLRIFTYGPQGYDQRFHLFLVKDEADRKPPEPHGKKKAEAKD